MAEQLEFFSCSKAHVAVSCQSDERGFCRGCMRSRDERFKLAKNERCRETKMYCGFVASVSCVKYAQTSLSHRKILNNLHSFKRGIAYTQPHYSL
ncbi:Putative aldo/keto reductase [Salmonella enterica subsp. enterica]|uniref:Aldo/keto reductase n=1 Tax=Salmonella enterica I TaxID=59201 RepID=A0A447U3S7_SALET|nr:Putative aldo/keto reductase [Salmonella enterica subsp. enterica]